MKKLKFGLILAPLFGLLLLAGFFFFLKYNESKSDSEADFRLMEVGTPIDEFNGVSVYYNGGMHATHGRNTAPDGYNLGLKYQCVEFVKRYYYEHLDHKMPNAWGHAVSFYNKSLSDGDWNADRSLTQYSNPSSSKPQVDDLMVYNGTYGHVSIICDVGDDYVEVIQQNVGIKTRATYSLSYESGKWKVSNNSVLGWLRK